MGKSHLKRITAPASWSVERKEKKFIARPKGSFSLKMGMPLITVLRDALKLVETRKEGKRVLNSKEVLVNGIRRKDEKFMVGLMDVLGIRELGKSFRMVLDNRGILRLVPINSDESSFKLCKIVGKRSVRKGRIQLSFHDGRSYLGTSAHSVGDTVVITVPEAREKQHLRLENGCQVYLTGGSNVGLTGVVDSISGSKVAIRMGDGVIEAAKRFVFVIGKDKPVIKLD